VIRLFLSLFFLSGSPPRGGHARDVPHSFSFFLPFPDRSAPVSRHISSLHEPDVECFFFDSRPNNFLVLLFPSLSALTRDSKAGLLPSPPEKEAERGFFPRPPPPIHALPLGVLFFFLFRRRDCGVLFSFLFPPVTKRATFFPLSFVPVSSGRKSVLMFFSFFLLFPSGLVDFECSRRLRFSLPAQEMRVVAFFAFELMEESRDPLSPLFSLPDDFVAEFYPEGLPLFFFS